MSAAAKTPGTRPIRWTHPSVRALLQDAEVKDPVEEVTRRARGLSLRALEEGWSGPPYDPFDLTERSGIQVVPLDGLEDARLVSEREGRPPRIEFNPTRRPARIRFSVAHELGHWLFPDHADRDRYRNESHVEAKRADDWQLELLCNIAAAELLMPVGALPQSDSEDLSLPHLLDLRPKFVVSTEALLRRLVKLTVAPAAFFAATRLPDGDFRLDYVVPSQSWRPGLRPGDGIGHESVLSHCTAVGYSDEAVEEWTQGDPLRVQAVGIPGFPGHRWPRVVGLIEPSDPVAAPPALRYVRGDASEPRREGPTVLAHVVNDSARRWGGHGLATALGRKFRDAGDAFHQWASDRENRRLGSVHYYEVEPHFWIASMVAQKGYGETPASRPRLRLSAVAHCLETVAAFAQEHAASVHVPLLGTGQGGMDWAPVRDLLLDEVCARGISVTVYVLPKAAMPDEAGPAQLSLLA